MTTDREKRRAERQADIDARIQADMDAPVEPAVARVLAAVADFDTQLAELLATFPAEEADAVRRGVYLDADKNVRTRHRALRSLP